MDKRGYRQCVRTVIIKGDLILLGRKMHSDGSFMCYEFPGGGIEDGDTKEETVLKECLEEVGILVTDITDLHISKQYEIDYPNPARAKLYRGGQDNWFTARFVRSDKSQYNNDNDTMKFTWESIDNAIAMIKHGPQDPYNSARIEVLQSIKQRRSSKNIWTKW